MADANEKDKYKEQMQNAITRKKKKDDDPKKKGGA